jgi:hypothetical protein
VHSNCSCIFANAPLACCPLGKAAAKASLAAGDPNCIHIASVTASQGQNYTVVVSDQDSFDAVLPISTVKYIYVSDRHLSPRAPASSHALLAC